MSLGFTEKLRLQGEASSIKAQLKSGSLGFMEKLNKQAEWKAIIDQLTGAATKPPVPAVEPPPPAPTEPADEEGTDEEAELVSGRSLVGLRLAGVNHPKWAQKFERTTSHGGSAGDLLVSNDQLEVCIVWTPTLGSGRKSMRLGWPRFHKGTSDEGKGQTISADEAWSGIKSSLPPALRKKVRYMVGQAEREAERILKEGVAGFAISLGNSITPVIAEKDGVKGGAATVAGAIAKQEINARGKDGMMAAAQSGQLYVLIPYVGALARGDDLPSFDIANVPTVAEWDTMVAAVPADSLDEAASERLAEIREALVALHTKHAQEPTQEPATGAPTPDEGGSSQNGGGGIVERYIAGEFTNSPYVDFRAALVEADKAGATLDQIKEGAVSWVEANPNLIQQAA